MHARRLAVRFLPVVALLSACGSDGEPDPAAVEGGLTYTDRGTGTPILFIHGSFMEEALRPLADEFSPSEFRTIRYHRRGYAGSDPYDGTLSVEREAADAARLVRSLGPHRVHVVGHSYGGVIGFELARSEPGLVASLVLIEPPLPIGRPGPPPAFVVDAVEAYADGDTTGAADVFFRGISGADWRRIGPDAVEDVIRNTPHFFDRELAGLGAYGPIDSVTVASLAAVPVLYILSRDSPEANVAFHAGRFEAFSSAHPNTETLVVADTDHLLPMQRPETIAEAIIAFVEGR